jgi:hypothetical protein
MMPHDPSYHGRPSGCLLFLLALLLSGCGSGKGTVTGRLTVGGKPVTAGAYVTIFAPTGESALGNVDKDGNYTIENAPLGQVKITVANGRLVEKSESSAPGPGKGPRESFKSGPKKTRIGNQVPHKYENPDNGLSYPVRSGLNTIDIELPGFR